MKIEVANRTIDIFNTIIIPFLYVIIGVIIFKVIKNIIMKSPIKNRLLKEAQIQRIRTIKILILNIIKYVIIIFVFIAILSQYGINVKSILAKILQKI